MKQDIIDNVKNIRGTKTKNKIVVLAIDDYGNIRTHSSKALENMIKMGIHPQSRFDKFDHLETKTDLEALYDVLTSVNDQHGNPAVFSPLAMSGNINFEAMQENGFQEFVYEDLLQSFLKLSVLLPTEYEGTWDLWKDGIKEGLMRPQFHGREHLNIKVLNTKLEQNNEEMKISLENRSNACISNSGFPNISPTAAFEFEQIEENRTFESVIAQGLSDFEKVYGYRATVFNAPGGREHAVIHKYLKAGGIKFIETPWIKSEHQGLGKYRRKINYSGQLNQLNMVYSVRNVVFEPTYERGVDWVNYTFKQIETAFRWNKPAIISSHRVNFCGMLDEKNRAKGLHSLKILLSKIVNKHPDVMFVGLGELCNDLYSR